MPAGTAERHNHPAAMPAARSGPMESALARPSESVRVLCAPDKFRDGLSASAAARAMSSGARLAGCTALEHPIADGGEGTIEALLANRSGAIRPVDSYDALGRAAQTRYAWLPDSTAVVVAADAIGLQSLALTDRDPLRASSRGLAAPILAAVAAGAHRIVVFLGGTATMDGGIGLLAALGAEVLDGAGRPLRGTGADLSALGHLDLTSARAALGSVELVVAHDVDSPLFGPIGAARVFGPQKGADHEAVERLDAGLLALAPRLGPAADSPGAGAAGGLGGALMALGAASTSGAELVLELTAFAEQLAGINLCITAEGAIDASTAAGKAVSAVLRACGRAGVACVVLGGTVTPAAEDLYALGAAGVFAIGRQPRSMPEALALTAPDLTLTTRAVCQLAQGILCPLYAVDTSR